MHGLLLSPHFAQVYGDEIRRIARNTNTPIEIITVPEDEENGGQLPPDRMAAVNLAVTPETSMRSHKGSHGASSALLSARRTDIGCTSDTRASMLPCSDDSLIAASAFPAPLDRPPNRSPRQLLAAC